MYEAETEDEQMKENEYSDKSIGNLVISFNRTYCSTTYIRRYPSLTILVLKVSYCAKEVQLEQHTSDQTSAWEWEALGPL